MALLFLVTNAGRDGSGVRPLTLLSVRSRGGLRCVLGEWVVRCWVALTRLLTNVVINVVDVLVLVFAVSRQRALDLCRKALGLKGALFLWGAIVLRMWGLVRVLRVRVMFR